MYKHKKDHDALFEAFQQVQDNQQINERGGWWDKTLAKSPIANKMFGGVSQRAQGRVTSKNDSNEMMNRFYQTLGRNNQPVDAQQLVTFISRQVPGIDTTKLPALQGLSGSVAPKQIAKMMPQIVDQIHDQRAGGSTPTPTTPVKEVDPNSMFNNTTQPTTPPPAPVEEPPVEEPPVAPTEKPTTPPPAPVEEPPVAPTEKPTTPPVSGYPEIVRALRSAGFKQGESSNNMNAQNNLPLLTKAVRDAINDPNFVFSREEIDNIPSLDVQKMARYIHKTVLPSRQQLSTRQESTKLLRPGFMSNTWGRF